MSYDVDAIRSGLRAMHVIATYSLPVKRGGHDEVEAAWCPRRADHSRRAFVLNTTTGLWRCIPCDYSGDLIALVMELERKTFVEALPIAARLAGVTEGVLPSADALRERKRIAEQHAATAVQTEARRRTAAIASATKRWESLQRWNTRGAAYLAGRGLELFAHSRSGWVVRYDWNADPSLKLHTSDGQIVNVVTRRMGNDEPKVRGMKDCPTAGTLCHAIAHIDAGNPNVVVVEGFADSLTAVAAFPDDHRVLGAHGANNLERITKAAAARVRACGGRLLLVPHNDGAGEKATTAAIEAAQAVGLRWRENLFLVDLGGHKDLNDAYRAGWRYAA